MADTWRENAIVEAILIIADKKIAQAGYDKTIKGVINKVIDKTKGKYLIRYQDSLFEAFSTSAKIEYIKDQLVSVLIPGSDWDRVKTILGGVDINATNYQQVPVASLQYNSIGPNGISFNDDVYLIGLSSYVGDGLGAVKDITDSLKIDSNLINHIKKGDSIALGMTVRTALADSQTGGRYGLIFYLNFKDNITGKEIITKQFKVDTDDVIGHPYQLISPTLVETLFKNVDTLNFIGIERVLAFCSGFPENLDKITTNDIFISNVRINGASALTDELLNGYVLHIDCSESGYTLDDNISTLPVVAVLKVNGKTTTLNVKYYWFRENATVFRGDEQHRYSGYAGDGWECLNFYSGDGFVPKVDGNFNFNSSADDLINNTALVPQKVTKILCVAVYDNKKWIKGLTLIINNNKKDVKIESNEFIDEEKKINKVLYFLDNGSPTLTCKVFNADGQLDSEAENYTYVWSFKLARGSSLSVSPSSTVSPNPYLTAFNNYQTQVEKASKMAEDSAKDYIENNEQYLSAIENWKENFEGKEYIYKNIYYNFQIKKIFNYGTLYCGVYNGNTYIGTGSITLYNKQTLEGTYSLNILNGTQIFQYDEKGNSPFVVLVDRKAIDGTKPDTLSFTLLDNTGKLITYEQIVTNGYVKWLFPGYDTLLVSNLGEPDVSYNSSIATATDITLAANLYNIYNNKKTFSYSIEDKYKLSSINNTIKLVIKFEDIILLSYTDFTFPKNGDPGTNGTDLVAKLIPANRDKTFNSDRIYAHKIDSANQNFYLDSGSTVDRLRFFVYNNNREVYDDSTGMFWSCPPKTVSKDSDKTDKNFISINSLTGILSLKTTTPSSTVGFDSNKKPIHIVRGKRTISKNEGGYSVDYMAEYPICYVYTKKVNGISYRIKIKPKTGFKYVVYQLDGTRPDYDNQPFELRVLKLIDNKYWTTSDVGVVTAIWTPSSTNDIKVTPDSKKSYIATAIPSDTFNGLDLTCALIADVKVNNNSIGFIHIPIYRLINRYGNNAINGWDGNSIELGADTGTILAPQVGAGKKNNTSNDNTFTGVLMGLVKTGNSSLTGLFGYNNGQRSIFLDALTGKAEFGKQGAGKITLDPSQKINGRDYALIYSGNYPIDDFKNSSRGKYSVVTTGDLPENRDKDSKGMMIDLSTPQIGFGSGNFTVNSKGHLVAKGGGKIAVWKISDTALTNGNTGLGTKAYTATQINNAFGISEASTAHIWSGSSTADADVNFIVGSNGKIFSKAGRIAGWNISKETLYNSNMGMGLNPNTINFAYSVGGQSKTASITDSRIWSGNKFVVTNSGKVYANDGQIGPWTLSSTSLTNGFVGLGYHVIDKSRFNTTNNLGARIWSGEDGSLNFAVTNGGALYSRSGKIAGWNISDSTLSADGIQIESTASSGSIKTSNYDTTNHTGWQINSNGSAYFQNIYANGKGQIAGWTISPSALTSPESNGHSIRIGSDGAITSYDTASTNGWSITRAGSATFKNLTANGTGQIGGWKISSTTLSSTTSTNHLTMDSSGNISGGRIDKENNAYWKIDKSGSAIFNNLTANGTGLIAGWDINNKALTNGNVGLGENIITIADMNSAFGTGTVDSNVTGRFWGLNTANQNSTANFVVDNKGYLYSRKGQIGGWTINDTSLKSGGLEIKSTSTGGLITAGDSSGNNYWNINHDGSATFKNLTANGTGQIGGWEIGNTTLKGGELTLNSNGSMSGPGWSIDASGNASFSNGQGSFAAGGGSGVVGGVSIPSSGGGSWGGPGGVSMNAKNITLYTRLGLAKTSFSGVGDGKAHIAAQMTSIKNAVKIKEGSKTVTGTVTGTVDGKSISNGRCSISVPTYLLEYDDTASVPIRVVDIGSVIVTGWNKTDTFTANFLCSADPNQRFEDS